MPNSNSPDEKKEKVTEEKREFIKERIVKLPITKKQIVARAFTLLFSAVFFWDYCGSNLCNYRAFRQNLPGGGDRGRDFGDHSYGRGAYGFRAAVY